MALARRVVEPGLVHHSDRGSQYASTAYTDLLKAHGIAISMSRKGNPWDNAFCESFMKTLKYEEVHRSEYRDLAEARSSIREFLEKIYNRDTNGCGTGLRFFAATRELSGGSMRVWRERFGIGFRITAFYSSARTTPSGRVPVRLRNQTVVC